MGASEVAGAHHGEAAKACQGAVAKAHHGRRGTVARALHLEHQVQGYSIVYLVTRNVRKNQKPVGVAINQQAGDRIHIVTNSIMAAAPHGQNQAKWHRYRQ